MLGTIAEVCVNMLMLSVIVVVGVGMDGNMAGDQSSKHGEAGKKEDAGCRDIEATLPTDRHRQAAEVGEKSGTQKNHSMPGSEANREESDATEVMTHHRTKGGDGGQVVRTQAVQDTRQKYGQQQHGSGANPSKESTRNLRILA